MQVMMRTDAASRDQNEFAGHFMSSESEISPT